MDNERKDDSSCSDEETYYSAVEEQSEDSEVDEYPFHCKLCVQRFGEDFVLESHYLWHELKNKKMKHVFSGEEIYEKARNIPTLSTVLQKQKKTGLVKCTICRRKFLSRRVLGYHVKEHTLDTKRTQFKSVSGYRKVQKKKK